MARPGLRNRRAETNEQAAQVNEQATEDNNTQTEEPVTLAAPLDPVSHPRQELIEDARGQPEPNNQNSVLETVERDTNNNGVVDRSLNGLSATRIVGCSSTTTSACHEQAELSTDETRNNNKVNDSAPAPELESAATSNSELVLRVAPNVNLNALGDDMQFVGSGMGGIGYYMHTANANQREVTDAYTYMFRATRGALEMQMIDLVPGHTNVDSHSPVIYSRLLPRPAQLLPQEEMEVTNFDELVKAEVERWIHSNEDSPDSNFQVRNRTNTSVTSNPDSVESKPGGSSNEARDVNDTTQSSNSRTQAEASKNPAVADANMESVRGRGSPVFCQPDLSGMLRSAGSNARRGESERDDTQSYPNRGQGDERVHVEQLATSSNPVQNVEAFRVAVWVGFALKESLLSEQGRHAIDLNVKITSATAASVWNSLLGHSTTLSRRLDNILDNCNMDDLFLGMGLAPIDVFDRDFLLPEKGYQELSTILNVGICNKNLRYADGQHPSTISLRRAQGLEDNIPVVVLYIVDANRNEFPAMSHQMPTVTASFHEVRGSNTLAVTQLEHHDTNHPDQVHDALSDQLQDLHEHIKRYTFHERRATANNYFGKPHWGSAYGRMVGLHLVGKVLERCKCPKDPPMKGPIGQVKICEPDERGNVREHTIKFDLRSVLDWLGISVSTGTYRNWANLSKSMVNIRRHMHEQRQRSQIPGLSTGPGEELSLEDAILMDNLNILTIPSNATDKDGPGFLPTVAESKDYPEFETNARRLAYPGVRDNMVYHRVLNLTIQQLENTMAKYMAKHNLK